MEAKSVGTFPVILLKLATPPIPPQTKMNFEQNELKWVEMSANFRPQHFSGGGGGREGRRDKPKAEQNIVVRSRVLRSNYLEGFFHTAPSSFVLHIAVFHVLGTL